MDHLPQLQNPSSARTILEVPFLRVGRFDYDDSGLQNISNRRDTLISFPDNSGTDWELSALFQAWLFFGTLKEILQVYGIDFEQNDFVRLSSDGREVASTRLLQDYIAAWIVKASLVDPGVLDRSAEYSKARRTGSILGVSAGQAVRDRGANVKLTQRMEDERSRWHNGMRVSRVRAAVIHEVLRTVLRVLQEFGPKAREVEHSIWDSVIILCATLQNAGKHMYRHLDLETGFDLPFNALPLRKTSVRFRDNGWCKREKKIIADLVDGDQCILYLCAQLDRKGDNHTACTRNKCEAYQVKEGAYRTRHVTDGCNCSWPGFDSSNRSPLAEAAMRIPHLPQKLRPAPMITYAHGKLNLVDANLADPLRRGTYVAISHVWADGMGNEESNALPECQLARIQDLVNKIFPPNLWPVPFWLDTLCIPVNPSAKKEAIKQMEWIYKSATKVLVLDRRLYTVSTVGMSAEEIGLRIMCSAWSRRLWTLQEGLFQARVLYQFADSKHAYDELNMAVRKTHAFPGRARSIPEGHHLHDILEQPPNCQANEYEPLYRFAHKPLSPCWPQISKFFKELNIRYNQPDPKWFPGMQLVPGMRIMVPRAIRTIMNRTTSKIEDEALIVSSLACWWAGSSAVVVDAAKDQRFKACFQSFHLVPSQLIFLDQQRYEEEGARWIPKTLLSHNNPLCPPLSFEHRVFTDEFSWPNARGITAEYPSWTLSPLPNCHQLPRRFCIMLDDLSCIGSVHVAGTQQYPTIPFVDLAIVVEHSFRNKPDRFTGVVVRIRKGKAQGGNEHPSGLFARLKANVQETLKNALDSSRIIGRHEALVSFVLAPSLDTRLPNIECTPMIGEHQTTEGYTRWRIG